MWEDGTVALHSNALLDTRCNIAINFKKVFGFVASILNLRASQLNLTDAVRNEQHLSLANLNEKICKEDCRVEIVEVIASWYHGQISSSVDVLKASIIDVARAINEDNCRKTS